ncbi:DUF3347 domain-containing protein [Leptospira fletcheri]|uniref:DUF3347 domain-containing protein n=1 Tax=Leptospira fletcheri TaxID=2484981 RepID=A0A4R9GG82_9LEPT|nr:DUF3347 domain-containing protein [Leptospira fletcheri]TGK11549.1 DUF3347 domain-containing protein [Leptospira fletcheri]
MKLGILTTFTLALLFLDCGKKELKPVTDAEKPLFETVLQKNQEVIDGLLKTENRAPDTQELEKALDSLASANGGLSETAAELKKALKEVEAPDLEGSLIAYSKFSDLLASTMKGRGLENGRNRFYCPMVKKTWVASGSKIRNPYAPDMRDCGDIVP